MAAPKRQVTFFERLEQSVDCTIGRQFSETRDSIIGMKASGSELDWLNFVVKVTWPYARQLIISKLTGVLLDSLAVALSAHKEIAVKELDVEFDPGSVAPIFKSLQTHRKIAQYHWKCEGIQVEVEMEWKSGSDFKFKPMLKGVGPGGVPINIGDIGCQEIQIQSVVSAVFAPLVSEMPLFGDVSLFFFDPPNMTVKVTGLRQMGVIGRVILGVVKRTAMGAVLQSFVLPSRVLIKARGDVSLESLLSVKSPLPLGVLEIEVLEATDLRPCDFAFSPAGKPTSDPFVIIRVGNGTAQTRVVTSSLKPQWNEVHHLLVYSLNQLVRIDVFDADVWTDDDLIGYLPGYSVYWLCKDADSPEGVWMNLVNPDDESEVAGSLCLRARFLDIKHIQEMSVMSASLAAPEVEFPRLMTVKLLGLEGQNARHLEHAKATVEWLPRPRERVPFEAPESPKTQNGVEASKSIPSNYSHSAVVSSFCSFASKVSGTVKNMSGKIAAATRVGFHHEAQEGIPNRTQTQRASFWHPRMTEDVSPQVARIIEQLHHREHWDIDRIAAMVGLDEQTVKNAASMRSNFEVVWHEAHHFLQASGTPTYVGAVRITVSKFTGDTPVLGLVTKAGLVGAVQLNLSKETMDQDKPWSRRVRAHLRRQGPMEMIRTGHEKLHGDSQCDESIGSPLPGVLIEFSVEMRALLPLDVDERLEEGQTLDDRRKLKAMYWTTNSFGLTRGDIENPEVDQGLETKSRRCFAI